MLKNVSTKTLELRWNLTTFVMKPNDTLDVTSFGVTNPKQISQLEERFTVKFKGALASVSNQEAVKAQESSESAAASSSADPTTSAQGEGKIKKKKK